MSKMFDYISGIAEGGTAKLEASLEHALGHLGIEIEENEKLRVEIARLRAALEEIGNLFDSQPGASAMARAALANEHDQEETK